jgi:hypothetical protein
VTHSHGMEPNFVPRAEQNMTHHDSQRQSATFSDTGARASARFNARRPDAPEQFQPARPCARRSGVNAAFPERGCVRSTTRSTFENRGALETFERGVCGEAAAAGPLDTAALRARKEARA